MRVEMIGWTAFDYATAEALTGGRWSADDSARSADDLAEFAGRNCYQSWSRPRPATAKNADYLANIIEQGHTSVFTHASATFYIDGVSRSFLTELNTHAFLKSSVVSQRYTDPDEMGECVIPPAARGTAVEGMIRQLYTLAVEDYQEVLNYFTEMGLPRKAAREAARAVLPNCTPVKLVVSGNLRAWRDFLGKRYHAAADAEIREVSTVILRKLRGYAPATFQDFPDKPFGTAE